MNKFKSLFTSIYTRFLIAFLGTFILSVLLAGIVMNITQFPTVKKMVHGTFESKVSVLKAMVYKENIPLNRAVEYMSSVEVEEEIFNSLEESKFSLNEVEKASLEQGEVISKISIVGEKNISAIFKMEDKYIVLRPNMKTNPLSLFFTMQRFVIFIPIVIGGFLIFFVTITVAKPIKRISEASTKVAKGDFTVELPVKGQDEIADLTRNFNHMTRELSRNEYLHKDFVSNVSHEFKTPITSLKGYAKLLKKQDLAPEKRLEFCDIIITESQRLSNLSSNLLKLSELENGAISDKKESFSLDEQIRDVVLLLQNQWEEKNLDLDLNLPEVTFTGYKMLMYQGWVNLIGNAIKYSKEKGSLKITLIKGEKIQVEILDEGIGMTKEEVNRVFDRFFKGDTSRNSSGTGLGLSITKKIVELHKGTIAVESELHKGSKFTVVL